MSKRLLLLAALVATGACASAPRGVASEPLAARLNVTASGMDVGLSDEAHVAVFAVAPGYGVNLVYPQPHERTLYTPGWNTLSYQGARRASYGLPAGGYPAASASTVLVLIASREPIDVRRFTLGATTLERALGTEVFRSYDADAVIGGLTRLTVPRGRRDEDWSMDVVAIPGGGIGRGGLAMADEAFPFEQPYVMVSCATPGAKGPVMVHVEFARYACPPADAPAESDTTAAAPADGSSGLRAAITRRTYEGLPGGGSVNRQPAERATTVGREPAERADRREADGRSERSERATRVQGADRGGDDATPRGAGERSGRGGRGGGGSRGGGRTP